MCKVLTMRKLCRLTQFVFLIMVLILTAVAAEPEPLDFYLINATGIPVVSVTITPHGSDDWTDNLMNKDILRDGDEVKILFKPDEEQKSWDIRLEDKEDNLVIWENVPLSKIRKIRLKLNKEKPVAEW